MGILEVSKLNFQNSETPLARKVRLQQPNSSDGSVAYPWVRPPWAPAAAQCSSETPGVPREHLPRAWGGPRPQARILLAPHDPSACVCALG